LVLFLLRQTAELSFVVGLVLSQAGLEFFAVKPFIPEFLVCVLSASISTLKKRKFAKLTEMKIAHSRYYDAWKFKILVSL